MQLLNETCHDATAGRLMMPMYPTSSKEYVGVIDLSGSDSGRDRLTAMIQNLGMHCASPGSS
jgi:hypothetical protein